MGDGNGTLDKGEMKTALGKLGLPNGTDGGQALRKVRRRSLRDHLARRVRRAREPDLVRRLLPTEKHGHYHLQLPDVPNGALELGQSRRGEGLGRADDLAPIDGIG